MFNSGWAYVVIRTHVGPRNQVLPDVFISHSVLITIAMFPRNVRRSLYTVDIYEGGREGEEGPLRTQCWAGVRYSNISTVRYGIEPETAAACQDSRWSG